MNKEEVIEFGGEWWFVSDWDPVRETGDELVGPFATLQEAVEAANRYLE